MKNIVDWLEDLLHERRDSFVGSPDSTEFAMLAGVLRACAQAEGYKVEELEALCGGDIPVFLLNQQLARRSMDVSGFSRSASHYV